MDEYKMRLKQTRRQMNQLGTALLVYHIIVNVAASLVLTADLCVYLIGLLIQGGTLDFEALLTYVMDAAAGNAWGYILAILAGCVIMLLWKGKDFCFRELFTQEKKMTPGAFWMLLCVFIVPQTVLQFYAAGLEWLLNGMGLSAMAALEMATVTTTGFSMFLYVAIFGPIAEELLFRGLLLRTLRPYGKQTAVFVSAILFSLFHGNVIQIPFAFLIGLVLGYVTVEYSIVWAIVLHVINNFVLSDLLGRLAMVMPEFSSVLLMLVLAVATIAAVVFLIRRRADVAAYFRENKLHKIAMKGMLTSPMLWIFAAMMLLTCLLTITRI